jgi:hypothetical protein
MFAAPLAHAVPRLRRPAGVKCSISIRAVAVTHSDAATPVVSAFYDRFPYPGDPLQDGPPPGYNWRWCVDSAWAFATGVLPPAPAA